MPLDRRSALRALTTLTALGGAGLLNTAHGAAAGAASTSPEKTGAGPAAGAPLQIVMLIHPDMTALDLVAPQLVFATMPGAAVHLVWKDLSPVTTDSGLKILPTLRLEDAPAAPDLLFVPGGLKGSTALMQDPRVLDFLRSRGAAARWVTSVCTGGLLLGAAGLLQGYRATTHWYVHDVLPVFGATAVDERVVVDRNRITGAGVTAGIDMALTVSAALHGEAFAQRQTLVFEYAPQPPFATGTPGMAGQALAEQVLQRRRPAIEFARRVAEQARAGWDTV